MWSIIIFLIVGILLGNRLSLKDKGKKINEKAQLIGLLLLLFSMGISIGANNDVVSNLNSIGLQAFVFALLTTLGSIICVFIVSRKLSKEVS
ncbi:LysO family transporter [Fusibacter sp. JL216-2]|uniref:LysO family transporter n=1 Tax=Fusibacter sp. JL216-2 TaxID=3071453 RepID=UPI003D349B21